MSWLLINDAGFTCRIIHAHSQEAYYYLPYKVDLIVTSPPYADARRSHYESIDPDQYPAWFTQFHVMLWEILKPEGSFVLNIKDKVVDGVRNHYVWRTIEALNQLGWQCIDDYIWHKKTSMPGHWPTRLRDAWEYVFHLAKDRKPCFYQDQVKVPVSHATKDRLQRLHDVSTVRHKSATGSNFDRNLSAWKNKNMVLPSNVLYLSTETCNRHHPAVSPLGLAAFFIRLLSKPGDIVLDPFGGSGTTAVAAIQAGRHCVLIDNKYDYCLIAKERLINTCKMKEIIEEQVEKTGKTDGEY